MKTEENKKTRLHAWIIAEPKDALQSARALAKSYANVHVIDRLDASRASLDAVVRFGAVEPVLTVVVDADHHIYARLAEVPSSEKMQDLLRLAL